jgi:tripartite-type tricarboxylate transporter receptor subunit TctC
VLLFAAAHAQAADPRFALRPVRMIVANGPGSAPDVVARLLGAKLTEAWGQSVVIDKHRGAEAAGTSVSEFAAFLKRQTTHWRKLLKESVAIAPKG